MRCDPDDSASVGAEVMRVGQETKSEHSPTSGTPAELTATGQAAPNAEAPAAKEESPTSEQVAEVRAERAAIEKAATEWNKTSKGWRPSNQCYDQSYNLQQHLESIGFKHWRFDIIGGSKWLGLKNHNVLEVYPFSKAAISGKLDAFTIDPYKVPIFGRAFQSPISLGTPAQFHKEYPGSVAVDWRK